MDEIVFQRETLRRLLQQSLDMVDKAAADYDAADDVPPLDAAAAVHASIVLGQAVKEYTEAVLHRHNLRTGAGGGE
jgi:hypothetical protein